MSSDEWGLVEKGQIGSAQIGTAYKYHSVGRLHNRNTRNRDRLQIPLCRTAAGQRAFIFRGQRLWNSLPDEFQLITNLDVFKVKIKQHFLRVFLEN